MRERSWCACDDEDSDARKRLSECSCRGRGCCNSGLILSTTAQGLDDTFSRWTIPVCLEFEFCSDPKDSGKGNLKKSEDQPLNIVEREIAMHRSRWLVTGRLGFGLREAMGRVLSGRALCTALVFDEDSFLRTSTTGGSSKAPFWLPFNTSPSPGSFLSPISKQANSPAVKIDGKAVAQDIKRTLSKQVAWMTEKVGTVPGLAMVRVGDRKDSELYVHVKQLACEEVGIKSYVTHLPSSASEEDILQVIHRFNDDCRVHGILVQLPLPSHIDSETVLRGVSLEKDVDGLNPVNMERLAGVSNLDPTFVPCTPLGCVELLIRYGVDVEKKHAVVIGCSNVVGFPTAILLQKHKASVTIVHVDTPNPVEATRKADIVVSATGVPQLVRGNWLKPGAIVIDVGTTAIEDPEKESGFRVIGDVCFEEAERVASAITPVPGGVGPMTTAMLLSNTVKAAQRTHGLTSR